YGVRDRAESERFWTDFGLTPRETSEDRSVFSAADGSTVVLRQADDPDLPPGATREETLREVTFGVVDAEDLRRIAEALGRDREVSVDAAGTVRTVDPLGFAVAFRVA